MQPSLADSTLRGQNNKKIKTYDMTDKLKVIKPFGLVEQGEVLNRDEDGMYIYTDSDEVSDYNNKHMYVGYNSTLAISEDYAKALVENGYLAEQTEESPFVNVFDEIDTLLGKYDAEIQNLNNDMCDQPACLKVEKETVLRNMKKLLEHLKSLKK